MSEWSMREVRASLCKLGPKNREPLVLALESFATDIQGLEAKLKIATDALRGVANISSNHKLSVTAEDIAAEALAQIEATK